MRGLAASMVAAGALWALAAAPASAYVRETVDASPDIPLFWASRSIEVRPAYDTSETVSPGEVRAALLLGLSAWETAGSGCTDLILSAGDAPSGLDTNLTGGPRDGENRIVWREAGWPGTPEQLALTTLVYKVDTGEILDADIDINGTDHFWAVIDMPDETGNDVQNTLTHEIGHLIGLAHTPEPDATMFGRSDEGEIQKRDLAEDDILGVCTVYPYGEATPLSVGAIAHHGLRSGTTCAVGAPSGSPGPWLFVVLVAVLAFRRTKSG